MRQNSSVGLTDYEEAIKAVTPAPGFRRDRVARIQNPFVFLDSGFRRNDSMGLGVDYSMTLPAQGGKPFFPDTAHCSRTHSEVD
jgi:hypothetical protein